MVLKGILGFILIFLFFSFVVGCSINQYRVSIKIEPTYIPTLDKVIDLDEEEIKSITDGGKVIISVNRTF